MGPETLAVAAIRGRHKEIVSSWLEALKKSVSFRQELTGEQELRESCESFIDHFTEALAAEATVSRKSQAWQPLREQLSALTDAWIELGFSPAELAGFVMLLRQPVIEALDATDVDHLFGCISVINNALDRLSLWATEIFQQSQQEIISRQQEELMELSTPVINVWEGIVALPLIGTLDSSRTQTIMESLLERIVEEKARVAILDITGVTTVDTLVAQHLLKAVAAARLMGADCMISGIRPSIAQTMVQLGVNLDEVATRATLADAFESALSKRGLEVCPKSDLPT